jgi:hypothetical protein
MTDEKKTPTDRELLAEARDAIRAAIGYGIIPAATWAESLNRIGARDRLAKLRDDGDALAARIDAALATPDPRDEEIARLTRERDEAREQAARLSDGREWPAGHDFGACGPTCVCDCAKCHTGVECICPLDAGNLWEQIATLTGELAEARAAGVHHSRYGDRQQDLLAEAERDRDALRERVAVLTIALCDVGEYVRSEADSWRGSDVTAVAKMVAAALDGSTTLAKHDAK